MFALRRRAINFALGGTRMTAVRSSFCKSITSARHQSNSPENTDKHLSDEEVDGWLQAIESLRTEFTDHQFLPETSLAPPGQSKVNILEEALNSENTFEPTEEQVAEWEKLKLIPVSPRKDETLQHITNMIMRHGKKQRAEKVLSRALYLVFCQTRQDPIEVLKKSLDDLAPLMVVKTFKTGVAKAAVIPVPLNSRQRNRMAWKWIVEGANKRVSSDFSVRLGEELISVFKGNSTGFDKRDQMHKTAIAHRAYIKLK